MGILLDPYFPDREWIPFTWTQFLWTAKWKTLIWQADENACKAMTPTQERQPWNIDDVCLRAGNQTPAASSLTSLPQDTCVQSSWEQRRVRWRRSAAERLPLTHPRGAVKWLCRQFPTTARGTNRRCKITQVQTVLLGGGFFIGFGYKTANSLNRVGLLCLKAEHVKVLLLRRSHLVFSLWNVPKVDV